MLHDAHANARIRFKDHELKLVVSDEVFEKMQRIKGLLAHSKPNATLAELIEYLATETLTRLEKQKGIIPLQSLSQRR